MYKSVTAAEQEMRCELETHPSFERWSGIMYDKLRQIWKVAGLLIIITAW